MIPLDDPLWMDWDPGLGPWDRVVGMLGVLGRREVHPAFWERLAAELMGYGLVTGRAMAAVAHVCAALPDVSEADRLDGLALIAHIEGSRALGPHLVPDRLRSSYAASLGTAREHAWDLARLDAPRFRGRRLLGVLAALEGRAGLWEWLDALGDRSACLTCDADLRSGAPGPPPAVRALPDLAVACGEPVLAERIVAGGRCASCGTPWDAPLRLAVPEDVETALDGWATRDPDALRDAFDALHRALGLSRQAPEGVAELCARLTARVHVLLPGLQHAEGGVRTSAARLLAEVEGPGSVPALVRSLGTTSDPAVHKALLYALADLGATDALAVLGDRPDDVGARAILLRARLARDRASVHGLIDLAASDREDPTIGPLTALDGSGVSRAPARRAFAVQACLALQGMPAELLRTMADELQARRPLLPPGGRRACDLALLAGVFPVRSERDGPLGSLSAEQQAVRDRLDARDDPDAALDPSDWARRGLTPG